MKKVLILVFAAMLSAVASANEMVISNVVLKQSSARLVTVSYNLGEEPAIVTVDFLTNGVSIGEANFSNVEGDVNRLVTETNSMRTIRWQPRLSWPGHTHTCLTAKVTAHLPEEPPDYMVVSLGDDTAPAIAYYVSTNAFPDGGLSNDIYRTSRLVMRRIHAAGIRWRMGAESDDYSGATTTVSLSERENAHYVTLSEDYFIGIYEITQAQGAKFSGKGSAFTEYVDSPLRPSSDISYEKIRGVGTGNGHAVKSGSALQKLRVLTGIDFDLPTSAQWEYACRAGTTSLLYTGKALVNANVYEVGWIYGNSKIDGVWTTQVVGQKKPNEWGLYDMLGNSREWCLDWYYGTPSSDDVVDPVGPATGSGRVLRGGDYSRSIKDFRPSASYFISDSEDKRGDQLGFRVVCPIGLKYNEK